MSNRFTLSLDSSQIAMWYECPEKWHLGIIEALQPRGFQSKPLSKGSYFHWLLESYYTGHNPKECKEFARERMVKEKLVLTKDEVEFLEQRFTQYRIMYSDGDFQLVQLLEKPAVEIGFSIVLVDTPEFLFTVEGKIDLIAEMPASNEVIQFIVDHKTQSRKYDHYRQRIQFKTYCMAANIPRIMVNYIGLQKELKDGHIRRTLHSIPAPSLAKWKNELISIFHRVAVMVTSGEYDQRWNACEGKWGFCPFIELCEQYNPEVLYLIKQTKFEKRPEWLPWVPVEGED